MTAFLVRFLLKGIHKMYRAEIKFQSPSKVGVTGPQKDILNYLWPIHSDLVSVSSARLYYSVYDCSGRFLTPLSEVAQI